MTESIEIREKYGAFCELAGSYFSEASAAKICSALTLADEKLAGMQRYDGSPLVGHSVDTAVIVIREIGLGRNSTISALLHDVVRMGMMSPEEVGGLFGNECTPILKALCNISDVEVKTEKSQTDNFRDLIISYSTDPRVILIKLADRLEVMRSLSMFPEDKRERKSWESLNLYAQIAHKLGLYSIKSELEDLSLAWLEPGDYGAIRQKLEASAAERSVFISRFLEPVEAKLKQYGYQYTVKSRTKSIYSIWTKMKRMNLPFEEIYDIFALRIILDCPQEQEKQACWGVYSIVTDFYTPNPERLRDWISIPKSNGYESLHTTVVTKDGYWVEIQIRSERMDAVAERGIAAHWRYKGVHQGGMGSEQWLSKLREMMEGESVETSNGFSAENVTGEIFVFTPKGDLRKMREGATLLDFAFDIHTNLGSTCTGGKVNQRNVSIREVLRNGDIVEIHTSKSQKPKADWLNIVTTSKARAKIKSYMREEQAKAASLGREELERKVKNWKLQIAIDDAVTLLCKYYKLKTGTELYDQIASGRIDISEIKELITRHLDGQQLVETKARKPQEAKLQENVAQGDNLIIDDSIRNIEYKMAKCCNPIRGDEVFGFVTVNAGITIHRTNCPNAARLKEMYPYRIMPAKWRAAGGDGSFQASISITTDNVTGLLNRITEVIVQELKINIRSMSVVPNSKGELTGVINIEVKGAQTVEMVIRSITKIKGVQRAYRVNN